MMKTKTAMIPTKRKAKIQMNHDHQGILSSLKMGLCGIEYHLLVTRLHLITLFAKEVDHTDRPKLYLFVTHSSVYFPTK